MSYGNGRTIGSPAHNEARMAGLRMIQASGYRGRVSVTAYYGADMYTVTDDAIEYDGYRHHTSDDYMPVNYNTLIDKARKEAIK